MRKVDQTLFGEGVGNCFAACLASILECDLHSMPNFFADYDADTWYKELISWLGKRGLAPLTQRFPGDPESFMAWVRVAAPNIPWIAGGPTNRGLHSCVYVGDQLVHDPNPNFGRKGLDAVDDATYILCRHFSFAGIDWCGGMSETKFYGAQNAELQNSGK